jgi:hypothetical protein
MFAILGISLFLLSFLVFLIPGLTDNSLRIIFFALESVAVLLVFAHIFTTGSVPLRGPRPWPKIKEKPVSAAFGILIYLSLLIVFVIELIKNISSAINSY